MAAAGVVQKKGISVLVALANVRLDGADQRCDIDEYAAANPLADDRREPALDEVKPRGVGRDVADVEQGVPCSHFRGAR